MKAATSFIPRSCRRTTSSRFVGERRTRFWDNGREKTEILFGSIRSRRSLHAVPLHFTKGYERRRILTRTPGYERRRILTRTSDSNRLARSSKLSLSAGWPFLSCTLRLLSSTPGLTNNIGERIHENTPFNLSLFGPPGSGKGSYGKHFAKALDIPLVTASDVLRKRRPDLVAQMANGTLVEDAVVGETVLEGLLDLQTPRGYILDGFPRTLQQVLLMENSWPDILRIRTVVQLDVPDFVCQTKLLGRRACSKCGRSYNIHGVDHNGWRMPPHLPPKGHVCESHTRFSSSLTHPATKETSCDWTVQRDDDTTEIVEERLSVYHQNADPILDYIRNNCHDNNKRNSLQRYSLLTLTPYCGFDDLPKLITQLCQHVEENRE